jgi:hypothetical protein
VPWQRIAFVAYFGPHRGNCCSYDNALDGTGHRWGSFVADVNDDRVHSMLQDLASALDSAVPEVMIV